MPARVLVRHFLRQFFSLDAVGTGGEVKELVVVVLTLLAAPGYLLAVLTVIGGPRLGQFWLVAELPPLLWYWKEEWLVLTLSMMATAVLAAVHWKSFVLDTRDYRILGPLPLRRSSVLVAKLASLSLVLLVLHAGVNALSGLLLPLSSPAGYWRTLPALQLTLLLQTVFTCASVLALQALATALLPAALAQRVSTLVQAGVLLAVAVLVVSADTLSERALALRDTPHALQASLVPVAWFMGLYKRLLGFDSARIAADARLALEATAAAVAIAAAGCLGGYRDSEGRAPGSTRLLQRWGAALDSAFAFRHPARPRARGISAFVGKASRRSPAVALIGRGWLVLGIAVVLAGLGGASLRGQLHAAVPAAATVAPVVVLPFFGLVGLRLAAAYPANLEANWLFRVTETGDRSDPATGVRAVALRGVVPLVGTAFVPQAVLWGVAAAVPVALLGLAVALVSAEWLFLGFGKIPFTCSYLPGKANLRASWPLAAAIGFVYCIVLPQLVAQSLGERSAWLTLLALLALLWVCLLALSRRSGRREPLVFDERALPLVTQLRLDD